MRINAAGRAAIMTLVYAAVFVLLVVVQFPSAGPISARAGNVALKALPGEDGKGVRSVELGADGLRLIFSERYPLLLRGADGKQRKELPSSYEVAETGFSVRFDGGTTLAALTDAEGITSWRLTPRTKATSAAMHYELHRSASLAAPGDEGAVRITIGQVTYRVNGALLGEGPGVLEVVATRGTWRPFFAAAENDDKRPAQPSSFIAQAPMDPAAWAKVLGAWRDKAWQGLAGPGFDAAAGAWKPAGSPEPVAFDEPRFIAFMAEAMRRERYEAASSLQAVVRASHADRLSWRSAPFAGKTMVTMAAFEEASLAEVKAIERLVQSRSPSLFYRPGIVHLLLDRAPYSLAKEALSLARDADFSKASPVEAIALIEAYLDARDYLAEEENPFGKAAELVDRVIAPAIRKAEGQFFLQTGNDGECEASAALRTGKALIRLAEATGKPLYAGIGQSLVAGMLSLSAADGSLPAIVTVRDETLARGAERLSTADAYALVGDSPYYPRARSLYRQLGPGTWAWTCAPELSVEHSPEQTVIKAGYPLGSTHYMVLYGVKPYARIQLYGINYNMDPSFENYNASGYYYKRAAGAMYLKMRHKAPQEEIRLFY